MRCREPLRAAEASCRSTLVLARSGRLTCVVRRMNVRLLFKRIIHGSSGNLKPCERGILDALLIALPPEQARLLSDQLAEIEIIQRSARGRMVLPFYSSGEPPEKLPVPDGEFCLARVQFTDGSRAGSARVQIFNGHFRGLEFSRPPQDFSKLRVTSVELQPKGRESLADALDRLEHGSSDA